MIITAATILAAISTALPYLGAAAGGYMFVSSIVEANKNDARYEEQKKLAAEQEADYKRQLAAQAAEQKAAAEANEKLNQQYAAQQEAERKKYTPSGRIQHLGSDRR